MSLTLDGNEWSAWDSSRFTPAKSAPVPTAPHSRPGGTGEEINAFPLIRCSSSPYRSHLPDYGLRIQAAGVEVGFNWFMQSKVHPFLWTTSFQWRSDTSLLQTYSIVVWELIICRCLHWFWSPRELIFEHHCQALVKYREDKLQHDKQADRIRAGTRGTRRIRHARRYLYNEET